jgi:hypothetical protein
VILFAFSTIITWGYYGVKAWTYLLGEGAGKELAFKIIFCVFVFIGAVSGLEAVIDFSDAAIFAMALVKCRRALPADAGRQARAAKLPRAAEVGRDQACRLTPDPAMPASFT